MSGKRITSHCIMLAALTTSTAANDQLLEPADQPPVLGRLALTYRGAWNVRARFKNLGYVPQQSNPGPATGSGVDRFYDDGFNRVDASGNAGGLTSFWGYQHASQVPGNDTIVMNSSSVASGGLSAESARDPQHGFELTCHIPMDAEGHWRWGFEAAFGFTDLTFEDNRNFLGDVTRISDAFALNGITPPVPPYSGRFGGPGALIGDSPTRTSAVIPGGASVVSRSKLDASLYELRLGPYVEVPLWKRLSCSLSGGLTAAHLDSTFEFSEAATMADVDTTLSVAGRDSHGDFLLGGFVAGQLSFAVTDRVRLLTGAQFHYLDRFSQSINRRTTELDLTQSVFITAGVGFSF